MTRNAMYRDYTTADLYDIPLRSGSVLPVTEYLGGPRLDMSAGIPGGIGRAVTAPARAYRGEMSEDQMIDEGANLAGWLTLGGYMAPKPTNALGAGGGGIKAYHGSPHDFDRFSMEHIGKGEGAQAYGHGLYFAENEGVARSYKPAGMSSDARGLAASKLKAYGSRENAIKALEESAEYQYPASESAWDMRWRDAANLLRDPQFSPDGHMYEVRINADPNDFLDWDKPFREQPKHIQEKIEAALAKVDKGTVKLTPEDEGSNLLSTIEARLNRPAAADVLREAGIPGIRYLDQLSRGAGEGSSNYVVFDDAMIEILRKYGWLGPVGAAPVANAMYRDNGGEVY